MTTKAYVTGLNAIVEQQKVARQASLDWIAEVTGAQSEATSQLVESYDSVAGDLSKAAEEATQQVSQTGVEVAKRSRDAATTTQRAAQTRKPRTRASTPRTRASTPRTPASTPRPRASTPRPQASTTPKPASPSTAQPGPARWTAEAYESLTAAEINEKLSQFSQSELREVETYEKAHQSRLTVLNKISSLQGEQPLLEYDELNVPEIHARLVEGDDKLAASVRDYERPHKSREGVLQAADAKLDQS